ncbi:acyl-CoA dehydrogenase family protein, partial [Streptomyces sp. NPDC004285]
MGIAITHEQRELARSVRGWLTRAVPPEEVRKHLDVPDTATGRPAHWDAAAEQGLLGLHLPEEHGGGGGGLGDLAVVVEEAARALLPGPFLPSVLAAELLHRCGHHTAAAALARGERIGAVALGGTGTLTAVRTASGWLLDGTGPPVLGGAQADLVLLRAATADGSVWLAADTGSLAVRPHESADPTRPTAEITARAAHVPADRELALGAHPDGTAAAVTALVQDRAAVLFAADACGTAARAVDTAAEHARTREQFGRPIGQFQGVKHLCADMLVRLEQARALTWDAARAGQDSQEGVRSLTAALAAATALDAAYSCAKDCIQILGGTGFTWEHDAHLLLRRALVARQLLGTGDQHRLAALRH